MTDARPKIKLLHVSADAEGDSDYRVLVDNKHVKYLRVDQGLYNIEDMCFEPVIISLFPRFPPGDWNAGQTSRDPETGNPHFAWTDRREFPSVKTVWHPTRIDHLELKVEKRLKSEIYEVTHPSLEGTVIAKLARFWWEIGYLEAETAAYEWLKDSNIGPAFLGHITEDGRVIGFLVSQIDDCQHATPDDYDLCHSALSDLHRLGIKHGDTNKHNFLIQNGKAILIDFSTASRTAKASDFEEELQGLQKQLEDTSGRGRPCYYETAPEYC